MKEKKLPTKLSDTILLALKDLQKVEKEKDEYAVSMDVYHQAKNAYAPCSVCFAGAVMAKTLGTKVTETVQAHDFCEYNGLRLEALDFVRTGSIASALSIMHHPKLPLEIEDVAVTEYSEDPELFKRDMRNIATLLKAFNQ